MKLFIADFGYLGTCIEGFLFGIYSGIFAIHLHYHLSREDTDFFSVKKNFIFYALSILFVFTATIFAIDLTGLVFQSVGNNNTTLIVVFRLQYNAASILFACSDFIAQSILIHRCWHVWGRDFRVVIIPSIISITFLIVWIAAVAGDQFSYQPTWSINLTLTALAASMTVNALVTGLIVFRIFRVFHTVKSTTSSDDESFGTTRGATLRSIIFIIIESGMALFVVQLFRLVISCTAFDTDVELDIDNIIVYIHTILNGITPTIILVRVSMGLSFHDERSFKATVSSLRFMARDVSSGMGSIAHESIQFGPDDPIPSLEKDDEKRQ